MRISICPAVRAQLNQRARQDALTRVAYLAQQVGKGLSGIIGKCEDNAGCDCCGAVFGKAAAGAGDGTAMLVVHYFDFLLARTVGGGGNALL